MNTVSTRYGWLTGADSIEFYPDGTVAECMLHSPNQLRTPYGKLIPQYGDGGSRRKYARSLSFHRGGVLKSISLHEQTRIATPIGIFPAELLTFYENGNICRLFPLNGKLTGFWSEANEYELAEEFHFKLPFAEFKRKIISIHFYENGAMRSLTFWPKDSLMIDTPMGKIPIRIGFSLYPDGTLQSLEPKSPLPVDTPIGKITAYDFNANGMSGDDNSLCFTPAGDVQSLITSSDRIMMTDPKGNRISFGPGLTPNICDDQKMEPVPLHIEFTPEGIVYDKKGETRYKRELYTYAIQTDHLEMERLCEECSGYE